MIPADCRFALVLSGGSALGAYQAGVYGEIAAAGWLPDWISAASAGAVNGALIAGNAPDYRIERLRDYWQPGPVEGASGGVDDWRRTASVSGTLLTGRSNTFAPRLPFPNWSSGTEPPSLFDTTPLGRTLARLVNWDRLNAGSPRFTAAAVDIETGEDVMFDTAAGPITPDHIRASSALLPAFPPVEHDGRLLGDAGISANLPLDAVLGGIADERWLVLAVDLLPLAAPRPRTLTEVAERLQDLNFATQSRRAIEAWTRVFAERLAGPAGARVPAVTLIHLTYADQAREVVGKAFDFSPATIRERWDIGGRDARTMLAMLGDGRLALATEPGLHVHRLALRPD